LKPDEFIQSFFDTIQKDVLGTKRGADGKSARYEDSVVVATWGANQLWDVEYSNGESEPVRRLYDPAIARSAEGAANYFVDVLRRAAGLEPLPREIVTRYRSAGRPKTPVA
jgi:hypothetical protein